jgi:hypothetical protein
LITSFSGYNLGTEPIWVQFGDRKGCKFKNPAVSPVPRGSSLLGQFSHEVPRGTLLLVHLQFSHEPYHHTDLIGGPYQHAMWQAMIEPPQHLVPHGNTAATHLSRLNYF